jgi:hypothetical protein
MARPNLQLHFAHSPVLRYGLATGSFAIALSLALLAQRYGFRNLEVPLFLFAIAVTRLVRRDRGCDSCGRTFKFSLRLLLY